MTLIVSYLRNGTLLEDRNISCRLKVRCSCFVIMGDVLYKRGFSHPYLRYLILEEADYVMKEVHEGICGNYSGARSLVHKLIRAGYYQPTMQKDAQSYVKVCDKCQHFSNITRQPTEELTPMSAPQPFTQWGLDIVGPFPFAIRQLKFLVVGIHYFTKWVEAKPLATISKKNLQCFIWKSIICRFGIPRVFISDNGKQFDNDAFRDFCQQLVIKNHYSFPAHPQANEQVKVINLSLLKMIKNRLKGAKDIWPNKLPSVLWAYRTTAHTPIGEILFRLAFENEAVILAEVGLTSYQISHYNEERNEERMRLQLDFLDEVKATAEQQIAHNQDLMAKHYNVKVKPCHFQVEDLVLRKMTMATRDPAQGKLGPNQEGPYRIIDYYRKGTYHLETLNEQRFHHPWNIKHLRKYYEQQTNVAYFIAFFYYLCQSWILRDIENLGMLSFFLALLLLIRLERIIRNVVLLYTIQ